MNDLIAISTLNDFIFCPYSIYLHNVYMDYEFNNTKRLIDNIRENIKHKFAKLFTEDDSVVIFEVNTEKTEKYGNAIHRDKDIVFL